MNPVTPITKIGKEKKGNEKCWLTRMLSSDLPGDTIEVKIASG